MGVLDGKVAIVTGSARGIGRATAELLSEHGASVVINDLDGDAARRRRARSAARRRSSRATSPRASAPDELVQTAIDALGKIDIIVNNAGYTLDAPIHKMSDDWFQRMLDIHVAARSGSSAPPPRTCASRPRRRARPRARRSSARSSTSPRSRARWATPARRTTRPASRRSSA